MNGEGFTHSPNMQFANGYPLPEAPTPQGYLSPYDTNVMVFFETSKGRKKATPCIFRPFGISSITLTLNLSLKQQVIGDILFAISASGMSSMKTDVANLVIFSANQIFILFMGLFPYIELYSILLIYN